MSNKLMILRRDLLLLMAGAGFTAAVVGCGDDDVFKEKGVVRQELSVKLTLKNERGQETTTFKVGENIFFCLTASYSSTPAEYGHTLNVWNLFGTVPIRGVFEPLSREKVNVTKEIGGGFIDEDRPVAMAVFTADGQFVGYPMDIIYSGQQKIQSGESLFYECPWLAVGEQTIYSTVFGKTTLREPLPAGHYYTCNLTVDTTTLPHGVSYIKNKVDFTVVE